MIRKASSIIPRETVPVSPRLVMVAIGFGLATGGAKLATGAGTDVATAYGFIHSLQVAIGAWFGAQGWLALSRVERNWWESLERRVDKILESMGDSGTALVEGAARRETKQSLLTRLLFGFVGLLPLFLSASAGIVAVIIVDSRVGVIETDVVQYILVGTVAATGAAIAAWLFMLIRLEWRVRRAERRWRGLEGKWTKFDGLVSEEAFLLETTNNWATLLVLIVAGIRPLSSLRATETSNSGTHRQVS